MEISRRQFLATAGASAGATLLAPIVGRVGPAFGQAAPDPATAGRNRLVVIFLEGGNDGLNYVIPRGDVAGAPRLSVYKKVRPGLAYGPTESLALDVGHDADHLLGLNRRLPTVYRFYREGRVAIVQGVDYPKHSYSHFTSMDIWHSGEPERAGSSGWIGRHLDRVGAGEGELRGVGLGSKIPLMLTGQSQVAAAMTSIAATKFGDRSADLAGARHIALARFGASRPADPLRNAAGRMQAHTVHVVDELGKIAAPPATGTHIGDALLTARVLLEQNLGVECVYLSQPGYDTHANQMSFQESLLGQLDAALETFWLGTAGGHPVASIGPLNPAVASRTLVVIVSEFGRRIGEAGGASVAGTDHGAAQPVVIIGPPATAGPGPALVGGLHGDHPSMGTVASPADNLTMTTDLRTIYQAVLQSWLASPDPLYSRVAPLPGLFVRTTGQPGSGPASAGKNGGGSHITTGVTASGSALAGDVLGDVTRRGPRGRMSLREAGDRGSGFHPASAAAAAILDALVLLLLVRSGQLRNLGQKARAVFAADTLPDD